MTRLLDELKVSDQTGEAVLANITADRGIAATTLQVDSVDNWPQKFIFVTGSKDANNFITPGSMTVAYGHLDTGDIVIDGYAPGYTDAGNTSGQVAVVKPTTYGMDELIEFLELFFNNDGTPKDGTVSPAKWTNPYSFVTYQATADSIPNAATTDYGFDTVEDDPSGGFNTSTGEFTIPAGAGGSWRFNFVGGIENWTDATRLQVRFTLSGSVSGAYRCFEEESGGTLNSIVSGSRKITVQAGDTVKVQVFHTAGGSRNTIATVSNSEFSGELIRP